MPERNFGGLRGFFTWLEERKYKMHLRVFLSRWRSYRTCPACNGARLRPEALATQVGGKNIAEICALKIRDALAFFRELATQPIGNAPSAARCSSKCKPGSASWKRSGWAISRSIDRCARSAAARRNAFRSPRALGSSLVNMLYVLDEPSVGLHPADVDRLGASVVLSLRDRGNTVCVVEHEESLIRAADQVIEIGPGAGERGGEVVFQGTPEEMRRLPQERDRRFSGRPPRHQPARPTAAAPIMAGFAWPARAATI